MAGLVDIAPIEEVVSIRGTDVTVTGLGADSIARILAEYPELRKLIDGVEPKFADVLEMAAGAIPKILAAGTGAPGNKKAIEAASRLTAGEQARIFAAILRVSAPGGVGPLVEEVVAAFGMGTPSKDAA